MNNPRIDQATFRQRFRKAVEASIAFAATMVQQPLPDSWCFLIEPNASFDEHPLVDDERLYPEDSLQSGHCLGPITFEQIVDWLWRDGKVPEWVDVSVQSANDEYTCVRLICCGRFTGLEARLYYPDSLPPFGIKSPDLPPRWESVEASGRFELPQLRPIVEPRPPGST